MQLQEVLEKRRSIREYQNKPVEREKIQAIIQAATLAPSWKNSQTARYYVVSGPKTLQAMKSALPEFNQKNVENVPVLIVTTFVTGRSGFGSGGDPVAGGDGRSGHRRKIGPMGGRLFERNRAGGKK